MAARKKAGEGEGAPKKRTSIKIPQKDLDKVWCASAIFDASPIAWQPAFELAIEHLTKELPESWYAYAQFIEIQDSPDPSTLGPEWRRDRYSGSVVVPAPRSPELLHSFVPKVPQACENLGFDVCRAPSNHPKHQAWMDFSATNFAYYSNPTHPLPPQINLWIGKGLHTLFQREYFIAFMHKFIDLLATDANCHYAYIDFSDLHHCDHGALHSHLLYGSLPFHQRLDKELWFSLELEQKEWVRGLYWGNYFGPHLCSKLGGAEKLIRDYTEHLTTLPVALQKVKKPEHIAKYVRPSPNGGVVLFLSEDPSEFSPGAWWRETVPHHGVANAFWLRKRLRDANVLM